MLSLNLGVYVNGGRPRSKKAIKEAVNDSGQTVTFYSTSCFDEYDGKQWLSDKLPDGEHYFVGPNPYADRKYYGTIIKRNGTITVK
jgi:hypothetical protein